MNYLIRNIGYIVLSFALDVFNYHCPWLNAGKMMCVSCAIYMLE